MLDARDWTRIENLFHAALALPPDEREAFVRQACADSTAVREQVLSLLLHDTEKSGLTRIVGDAATRLVGSPVRDGSVVGAYRLLARIGEGGMGVVYSAERADHLYEKRVAVKLVNTSLVTDELRDRFNSERQILAALEHANIARLLDGGSTDDGVPYLVMEYVQGSPLDEFCARRSLGIRDRLRLFVKICNAVHYAHQQLVIHCDLKMSNILVTEDSEPRLVDFGVSRLLGKGDSEEGPVAGGGLRRLTLRYASPEQVRGDAATTATDAYALGVILYELLAGTQPYDVDETDTSAYTQAILARAPRAPSGVVESRRTRRYLRGDLDSIVLRALQKQPSERYFSVARLSEDVSDYLALRPVMARAGSWYYRFGKLLRRNRLASGISFALLITAVIFTGALVDRNRQILAQRDVADFERDKAEAVTRFLTDMFAEASPDRAQGRTVTVRAVLENAGRSLRESAGDRFAENPLVAATIRRSIADVYMSLGMIEAAEPHMREVLEVLRSEGQTETVDYVRALLSKSYWLGLRFEHEEARAVAQEALIISGDLLGEDDPLTMSAKSAVAVTLHMTGDIKAAGELYGELYRQRAVILGERHHDTLHTLQRIGIIAHWLGDYAKAERHYRECAARSAETMGARHPMALSCQSNLGSVLEASGRYAEAEPVIRAHLEEARHVLGENHIDTLRSMHNLADVYRGLGRSGESEALFLETLERRRETLGHSHVETLQTQMKLARLYRQTQQYARAMPLMRDTLDQQRTGLGDKHPTTLVAAQEMADLLRASGDLRAAGSLYESVLSAREEQFGRDHPDLIVTLRGLAAVRRDLGDGEAHQRLVRRLDELAERHPQIAVAPL